MYITRGGRFRYIKCDIQKSIKIDKFTFEIIESCRGDNFSEKVRNLAEDYDRLKKSNT